MGKGLIALAAAAGVATTIADRRLARDPDDDRARHERAEQITDELRRHLEIPPDEDTDSRRRFTLDAVACLGCCSLAPVVMVNETTHGLLDAPATRKLMRKYTKAEKKAAAEQS